MTSLYDSEIVQILPASISTDPKVKALSYAIKKANQRTMDYMKKSMVYACIDELPEKILDVLAVDLRSQYYEPDMPIDQKRTIVKNTLFLYSTAGTPAAVEEMMTYIFGSGEVVEWFDTGKTPGTFQINTSESSTEEAFEKFSKIISRVKNIRSHLESINFGSKINGKTSVATGAVMVSKITIN